MGASSFFSWVVPDLREETLPLEAAKEDLDMCTERGVDPGKISVDIFDAEIHFYSPEPHWGTYHCEWLTAIPIGPVGHTGLPADRTQGSS